MENQQQSRQFIGSLYTARLGNQRNMHMPRINWGTIGTTGDAIIGALSRLTIYWPFSWRSFSALILGVLLAKWFWILFAPHAIYTSAMPERAAGLEAGRLFGEVAAAASVSQGVALPNVQLLGVFAANAGKPGFAILKLDEKRQTGVAEGEEVSAGTKLLEVHADYVLLERAGVQQRINLENKYAGAPNKTVAPAFGAAARSKQENEMQGKDLQHRLRQQHR